MQVLAKCYGEGFVKAAESLEARPHVTRDDSDLLRQDTEQLVRPIRDYNQALADKIYQIVDEGFASGKNDLQVAKDLRSEVRDILNNEPITIQRPGKRPVSFTAAGYADLIADVIPYSIRNGGYLRGSRSPGPMGGSGSRPRMNAPVRPAELFTDAYSGGMIRPRRSIPGADAGQ